MATPARRAALLAAVVVAVVTLLLLRGYLGGRGPTESHEEIHSARTDASLRPEREKGGGAPAEGGTAPSAPPDSAPKSKEPERLCILVNVPGAEVTVRFHHAGAEPESEPVTVKCDAAGRASVPVPQHPDYLLCSGVEARAEGYLTGYFTAWDRNEEARVTLYPEPPGPGPEPGTREPGIAGRVSFPDGRPAPRVTVELRISEGEGQPVTTSESGEYEFESLPRARMPVVVPLSGEEREVVAGSRGVDFVLRDHVVGLRFTDGKGRPFRGVWWHHESRVDGKVVDQGQNNPAVSVPAGGVLWVCPTTPYYPRLVTKVPVEGPPAFHDVAIVIEKLANPGALAVRLRSDTGDPPAKVYLVAKNEMGHVLGHVGIEGEVKTDSDGRVLFEGLPPGRVTVESNTQDELYANAVAKDYGLPTSLEAVVEAGKTIPVDLIVPMGGKIALTVLGPDGAVAPPGDVRIKDERGTVLDARFWSRDADGGKSWPPRRAVAAFLDDPLPPGRYTIEILRDQTVVGSKSVAVPRGETLEVEIRLDSR